MWGNYIITTRQRYYNALTPTLTYNQCQTWTFTTRLDCKITIHETRYLRRATRKTRRGKIREVVGLATVQHHIDRERNGSVL